MLTGFPCLNFSIHESKSSVLKASANSNSNVLKNTKIIEKFFLFLEALINYQDDQNCTHELSLIVVHWVTDKMNPYYFKKIKLLVINKKNIKNFIFFKKRKIKRSTWLMRTTLWSWSCEIIILQTVVLPDAFPPATPGSKYKWIMFSNNKIKKNKQYNLGRRKSKRVWNRWWMVV